MNRYYVPLFTAAAQIMVLFFAGLLNLLFAAVVALYAGGLLLFAYDGITAKPRKNLKQMWLGPRF